MKKLRRDGRNLNNFIKSHIKHSKFKGYVLLACLITIIVFIIAFFNFGYGKYIITEEQEITVVLRDIKLKDSEIIMEPDYWTNDSVKLVVETDKSGDIYYKKNEDGEWTKYEDELIIDENCDIHFKLVYEDGDGPETIKKITNIVKPKEEVARVTTDKFSVIFDSVQKAIEAAGEEEAVVTLLKDNIEECITIAENQNIVLDVNGKTLVGVNESAITNNGTLTISGESGTITCSGADTIKNAGTLVKDTETTIKNTSTASYCVINNTGETTISAGTIYSDWRGICNYDDGEVTITGGTLEAKSNVIRNFGTADTETAPAVKISGDPILTSTASNNIVNDASATGLIYIHGGTIDSIKLNIANPTVINNGNGKIIIEEGTIKCSGTNAVVYNGYNSGNSTGTVEIRGGTIESDTAVGVRNNEKGNVIISGGTITTVKQAIRNEGTGTAIVTGGTITSTESTGIYNNGTGTITLGDKDDSSVSTEEPSITGKTAGVNAESGTFNFYDGVIKGESGAGSAIKGEVADTPEGYAVVKTVDGTIETAILETTVPTILVSPASATACKSKSVTITVKIAGGESELSSSNSYQYYLSSSSTELKDGTWTNYTSGTAFTIGSGITGTRYLFVKRISNNGGIISTGNGTATTISGVTYQRFGSYVFDNTKPIAWINTESMYVTDGLVTRLDGVNNNGGSHSSSVATWKDISSNGKNGAITDGTWGANYLDFNGTSSWVNLGVMNSDYQTIEATFSPDIVPTSAKNIIGNWEDGGGGIVINSSGYIYGEYYVGGSYIKVTSTFKVVANQKYHVAVTYDGTNVILYVNGVEQGRNSVSGKIGAPKNSTVMALGVNPGGSKASSGYFDGKIYNAAVYNKALTADQVKKNADAGKALAGGPTNASSITYTIRFNEKVTGFTTDDITVTNGTKGTFTQVTEGSVYRVSATTSANQNNTQTIALAADGCTDSAGNGIAATNKTVVIDRVAPTVTLSANGGTYNITPGNTTVPVSTTLTASDTGSGIAGLSYAWGTSKTTEPSSWTAFTSGTAITKALSGGNNYLWTNVIDNAGNRATSIKTSDVFTVNYQVAFDSNNGTGAPSAQSKIHGTNLTLSSTKPTRTGYTFKEWNTKADGTGTKYASGASYTANSAVTLYAQWTANTNTKYIVNHYVHDLGATTYTLNSTDNLTGTSDASVTVANLKKTISGFTYEDGYITGNTTKPSSGAVTTTTILPDGTRVINLYYRRNRLYIQYNINGGTFSSNNTAYGTSGSLVTANSDTKFLRGYYGTTVNEVTDTSKHILGTSGLHDYNNPNAINISKTGYSAKSGAQWNTKADGTGTSYSHSTTTYSANNFGGKDLSTGDQTVVLYVNWTASKYKVTLDSQGATTAGTAAYWYKYNTTTTVDDTAVYYYADEAMSASPMKGSTITKPEKTGYTFGGYYTGTNGTGTQYINANGGCINNIYKVAGNTTLYAKWTANTYKVTANANGGTIPATTGWTIASGSATATKNVTYDSTYGTLPTPTKTGYTFTGWNGKNLFNKDAAPISTPTYIKGDGTLLTSNEYSLYQVSIKPNTTYTITNSGQSNAPGYAIYNASGTRVAGENYAMTKEITFTTPSTASYIKFSVVTQTTSNRYDKDTFQLEEGDKATAYEPYYVTSTTKVTTAGVHTLYAQWTANNYTITYDYNYMDDDIYGNKPLTTNFSSATTTGTTSRADNNAAKFGKEMRWTVTSLGTGTGTGGAHISPGRLTVGKTYTWSVYVKASKNITINLGQEQNGRKTVNLTTSWQRFTYTFTAGDTQYNSFTFYATGGDSNSWAVGDVMYMHSLELKETPTLNITTQTKTYGGTLGTLPVPSRTGYSFDGWYTAPVGGSKIATTTAVPAANTTYYARWKVINYTITYNSGNLLTGLYNQAGSANKYLQYSINNNVITATGKAADGWGVTTGRVYLEANKKYKFTVTTNGTYGTADGTVEVYLLKDGATSTNIRMSSTNCEFTPTTAGIYWLRVDVNKSGQTNTFTNPTISYVETKSLPYGSTLGTLPTVTRSGYTLNGWYTAASGGTKIATTTTVPAANTTYYGQWSASNYTLTLAPNSGSYNGSTSNATVTSTYNTNVNLGYPTRTGYTFVQWKTSDGSLVDKNILTNATAPAFSSPSTNAAGGWRTASTSAADGGARTVINVTDAPIPGITKGFSLVGNGKATDIAQDSVPVTSGQQYTISVWAKGTGTLTFQAGQSTYVARTFVMSNVSSWTKYSWTFTAGTDGSVANGLTNIYFGNRGSSGTIQICGMKLEAGYGFTSNYWTKNATSTTLTAEWAANTNTKYVVNHYVRNLGATTYTLNSTDNLIGTSNASVTVANLKKTISGFTYDAGYTTGTTTRPSSGAVTTVTIAPDGSTVINLYYRRNMLYVQYDMNGGALAATHGASYGKSGTLVTSTNNSTSTNFYRGVYGGKVGGVSTTTLAASSGLHNYNNTADINIERSGYKAQIKAEWNLKADGSGPSYGHDDTTIDATALATAAGYNLANGDVVVKLYVNWVAANYTEYESTSSTTILKYYPTLADAMSGVTTGHVIKSLKTQTDTSTPTLASGKNVILDLAGYTLTLSKTITNNGTLDIYNSSSTEAKINSSAAQTIKNSGTLTMNKTASTNKVTITNTTTAPGNRVLVNDSGKTATLNTNVTLQFNANIVQPETEANRYLVSNSGTLNVSGANLTNIKTGTTRERAINNGSTGKVNITSGTVKAYGIAIYSAGTAATTSSPAVQVSGGTVESTNSNAIYNDAAGLIYITAGTVKVANTIENAIYNAKAGAVMIGASGSTSTTSPVITGRIYGSTTDSGLITVNGGKLTATTSQAVTSKGSITINGGSISSDKSYTVYTMSNPDATLKVTGGTIESKGSSYVLTTTNTDGQSGTIEITGGTLTKSGTGGTGAAVNNQYGTTTITGGTIENKGGPGVYTNKGTITIGTNETTPSVSTTVPSITGTTYGVQLGSSGTFNFYDGVIKGAYEDNTGKAISKYPSATPTGYGVQRTHTDTQETAILVPNTNYVEYSGSTTTVVNYYTTLALALANGNSGNTIKPLKTQTDTSTATVASGNNLKLDLKGYTLTLSKTITNNGTLDIYSSANNGKINSSATDTLTNNGTLTLNGTNSSYTMTITNTSTAIGAHVVNNKEGKSVNVKGKATLTYSTAQNQGTSTSGRYAVTNYGTFTLAGGTITNTISSTTYDRGIINVSASARTIVSSGTITTYGIAINNNAGTGATTSNAAIAISGGTVTSTGSSAVYNQQAAMVSVTGGTISGNVGIYNTVAGIINISGSGASITGTTAQAVRGYTGTVTMSAGTLNGKTDGIYVTTADDVSGSATVTGGTITAERYGIQAAGSTTATLGNNANAVSTTTPVIEGGTNGVCRASTAKVYFYDGKIIGDNGSGSALNLDVTGKPTGYTVRKSTADGKETATLGNTFTITVKAGNGISKVALSGWTNTGTATMTKTLTYGGTLDLSTITPTFKTGYSGVAYVKTSGAGSINGTTFTVGEGVTTITLNATTLAAPAPSISTSNTTKIYGASATTLTATNGTSYDSGVSVYYKFGNSTTASGTYTYGTASTTNTSSVSATSHYGAKYYKVQAYATDGTLTSSTATWSSNMSVTLTAATITFNANEGTLSGTSSPWYARSGVGNLYSSNTGTTSKAVPSATRTGYTFNGWFTATSGGSKVLNADGTFTGTAVSGYSTADKKWATTANKTLYAQWTANNYTITFNYNGQHNYATPAATLTKSSFTGASNQGLTVATGTFDGLKSGDTLHITYDMSYTNLTAATGQSASLYSQGTCNPSGDWVTMGSSAKQTLSGSGTTKFDYTVSLTDAKVANNAFRVAIRFDYYASGSVTVSNVKITRVTTETKTLAYGTQLGTLPTPTEAGYTLNGWYTTSSGGTKISSTTTVPAKDTTYYAQWTANKLTIRIHMNGGALASSHGSTIGTSGNYVTVNGSTAVQTVNYGGKLGTDGLANMNNSGYINITRTGYHVVSGAEYNTKADGTGTTYNQTDAYEASKFADLSAGNKTVDLYVKWVANELTFGNQTKAVYYNSTAVQNVAITAATNGTGTYTYSISSQTNSSGTAVTGFSVSGTNIVVAKTTAVGTYTVKVKATDSNSAKTKEATYTITVKYPKLTLNGNSGTASPAAVYPKHGTANKYTGETNATAATIGATRTGYTLNGWYTAASGGTKVLDASGNGTGTAVANYTNASKQWVMTADQTLYAQWTYTATPTITRTDFNTFSYTASGAAAYYVSTSNTKPSAGTSQTGFALNKWTTATSTGDLTLAEGTTYYVWVENSATGTVSANSASIAVRKMTRSQGIGSTLTTGRDGTSATSTGTAVTSATTLVLNGTPFWSKSTANTGYNTAVLKEGTTSRTADGYKIVVNSDVTIASTATANELTFGAQTKAAFYNSTTAQNVAITAATNGTGTYTYSISSQTNSSGTAVTGFSVSGTNIVVAKTTAVGTYTVKVKATDSNSAKTKEATYTITVKYPKLTLNGNSGTASPAAVYPKHGTTNKYTGETNATAATIGATRTGYTLNGWYTAASGGTKVLNADGTGTGTAVTNYTNASKQWVMTANQTLYAQWTANELTFGNQTKSAYYNSTAAQNVAITAATNGTGTYTYSYVSATNSSNAAATGFSVSGTNIVVAKTTAVGTYTVKVKATDSNSAKTKEATYTITVKYPKLTLNGNSGTASPAAVYPKHGTTNKYTGETNATAATIGATRTGYTLNGWYTAATGGTKVLDASGNGTGTAVANYTNASKQWVMTAPQTLYAQWTANELTFGDQTKSAYYNSTAAQNVAITAATNGTGTYTYSISSQKNSSGTAVTGFSISGTNVVVAKTTAVGTYTVVVKATDSNSAKTKEATYTITVKYPKLTLNGNSGTASPAAVYPKHGTTNKYTGETNATAATIGATRTGYTLNGWYTAASGGTKVLDASGNGTGTAVANYTNASKQWVMTAPQTLYAQWTANELTFGNQTKSAYYNSTTNQNVAITAATNGTGTYTYSYVSATNSSNAAATGFSVSGTNIVVAKTTAVGTYTVKVKATDSNSAKTKEATYTITVKYPKLTLNGNSGTASPAAVYPKHGTTNKYTGETNATAATLTATRTGYTLNGWYTAASGGTKVLDASGNGTGTAVTNYTNASKQWVMTAPQTLYAQWTANELTFGAQTKSAYYNSTAAQNVAITAATNGTGTYTYSISSQKNSSGTAVTGFSISGTNVVVAKTTAVGTYTVVVKATDSNSAKTKEATYTITVKYPKLTLNGNSGTASPAAVYPKHGTTNKYTGETNATAATIGATRTGYTLNGWYTAASGGTKVLDASGNGTGTAVANYTNASKQWVMTANQTLYAQWTANELTFGAQTKSAYYNSTAAQNVAITAATNGTGTYTYSISSQKNSSGTAVTGFSISGTNVVVAKTTAVGTYTVVVKATDSNSAKTKEATYTITVKYPKLTLNGNSGTASPAAVYPKHGTTNKYTGETNATAATIGATRTGYTLNGWYTAATNGTKVLDASGNGTGTAVTNYTNASKQWVMTANQTLYAQWTANELTFGDQTKSAYYNSTAAQNVAITAATNGTGTYTYSYVSATNSSNAAATGFSVSGTNIVVAKTTAVGTYKVKVKATDSNSAKTKEATYTITVKYPKLTLNGNGGTASPAAVYPKHGTTSKYTTATGSTEATIKATRAGYILKGWYTEATGGERVLDESGNGTGVAQSGFTDRHKQWVMTEDKTLYAHWIELRIGDTVNYKTSLNGVTLDNWRIFHQEVGLVYLILADYLPTSAVNISGIYNDGDYKVNSQNRDTLVNAMITKTNWKSLLKGTINGNSFDYTSTTDSRIYANGSPTLDLYVKSWNQQYPSNKLYTAQNSTGYYVGTSANPTTYRADMSSTPGYSDTLYYPHTSPWNLTGGYWLATPSASSTSNVMEVYCFGDVQSNTYFSSRALRPIVCLPSSVLENANAQGTANTKTASASYNLPSLATSMGPSLNSTSKLNINNKLELNSSENVTADDNVKSNDSKNITTENSTESNDDESPTAENNVESNSSNNDISYTITTDVVEHTESYIDGKVSEKVRGGTITGEDENPYETVSQGKMPQKVIKISPTKTDSKEYEIAKIVIKDGKDSKQEVELDLSTIISKDGSFELPAKYLADTVKGMQSDKHIEVEFRKKTKVIVKHLEKDTQNVLYKTKDGKDYEEITGHEGMHFETNRKPINNYYASNVETISEGKLHGVNTDENMCVTGNMYADSLTIVYWYEKASNAIIVKHIEIDEQDKKNGLTLDSGIVLNEELINCEPDDIKTIARKVYNNKQRAYISTSGPQSNSENIVIATKDEVSKEVTYTEDSVIEVRYYYERQFNLNVEVKAHTEVVAGAQTEVKGGKVNSNNEVILKNGSSNAAIEFIPNDGYRAKYIKVNGKVLDINGLEKNNHGVVLEKGYFKNVQNNINVVVEFERIPAKVIVKYQDVDTKEDLIPNKEIIGFVNDEYNEEAVEIEGFMVAAPKPENNNGRMEEDIISMTYWYTRRLAARNNARRAEEESREEEENEEE